jgi:hypothetical protein
MPGSPVFHGIPTSTAPQGMGGSARVQTSSVSAPNDMNFFVWVFIIGVVIPILLIGGLQIGGFQFVFRR